LPGTRAWKFLSQNQDSKMMKSFKRWYQEGGDEGLSEYKTLKAALAELTVKNALEVEKHKKQLETLSNSMLHYSDNLVFNEFKNNYFKLKKEIEVLKKALTEALKVTVIEDSDLVKKLKNENAELKDKLSVIEKVKALETKLPVREQRKSKFVKTVKPIMPTLSYKPALPITLRNVDNFIACNGTDEDKAKLLDWKHKMIAYNAEND
jgi:DNA repair exonuclease SbcCD ATPase subunit